MNMIEYSKDGGPCKKKNMELTVYPFLVHFVHLQDKAGGADAELRMAQMTDLQVTVIESSAFVP